MAEGTHRARDALRADAYGFHALGDGAPSLLKAHVKHGHARLLQHDARAHLPLPIHREAASSRLAAHILRLGQHVLLHSIHDGVRIQAKLRFAQLPPHALHANARCFLGGKARLFVKRFRALPHSRRHVGVDIQRRAVFAGDLRNPANVGAVLPCHTCANAHIDSPLAQQANAAHRPFKAIRRMTQPFIGSSVRAVERDVHTTRLFGGKVIRPVFVDHRAVGVHGKDKAHSLELGIQLAETGIEQRLSSRQQQKKHARALHLLCKRNPLLCRAQPPLRLHLRTAQAHIAHIAVQVAKRRKLQRAAGRPSLLRGTRQQLALRRRFLEFHFPSVKKEPDCSGSLIAY